MKTLFKMIIVYLLLASSILSGVAEASGNRRSEYNPSYGDISFERGKQARIRQGHLQICIESGGFAWSDCDAWGTPNQYLRKVFPNGRQVHTGTVYRGHEVTIYFETK